MLKNAYSTSYLSVPRESILESVARFLQRLEGENLLVPVAEIESPDLGAPDLTFAKRGTAGVVAAMVHRWGSFAGFALRAAAYHRWLKACVRLSEAILNRPVGVETYVVSHNISSADSYLLRVISDIPGLFFVGYQVLEIEEQQTPVVRFHLLDVNPREKESPDDDKKLNVSAGAVPEEGGGPQSSEDELSSHEIEAFNLLKAQYLS